MKKLSALFISSIDISRCRFYKTTFFFNNQLYQYLWQKLCFYKPKKSFVTIDTFVYISTRSNKKVLKFFVNSFFQAIKFSTNVFFNITIIDNNIFENTNIETLFIMSSSIDFNFDINIDYKFKKWIYTKIKILFSDNNDSNNECLNNDANLILINKFFLKFQNLDLYIRIITSSVTIQNLKIN